MNNDMNDSKQIFSHQSTVSEFIEFISQTKENCKPAQKIIRLHSKRTEFTTSSSENSNSFKSALNYANSLDW